MSFIPPFKYIYNYKKEHFHWYTKFRQTASLRHNPKITCGATNDEPSKDETQPLEKIGYYTLFLPPSPTGLGGGPKEDAV